MTTEKERTNHSLASEITLVTAYFNIGQFPKGSRSRIRKPSDYDNWSTGFRCIRNPVVAFFDVGDPIVSKFRNIRKHLRPLTKIVEIKRNDLWTFRILKNVSKIFNKPHYPRHYPNTVIPEYACVSSSRFELVQRVIEENPFRTRYFAWIDFGFIKKPEYNMTFCLPPHFQEDKIAFTEVIPRNEHLTPFVILRRNQNWLAAGYFVGHYKVLHKFVTGYLNNLRYFLD